MKSLTCKLSLVFLFFSALPLIIGVSGAISIHTAEESLDRNNDAIADLSQLISTAGESISESIIIQTSANAVASQLSRSLNSSGEAFREIQGSLLPRTFALSEIRYQLNNAFAAKIAIFLNLCMRHLDAQTLAAELASHRSRLDVALADIEKARNGYRAIIMKDTSGEEAWKTLNDSLEAWGDNHREFMDDIERLTQLAADLVRGGPLFASASRKAYDTLFVKGIESRLACEKNILELNRAITRFADSNVRRAVQSQNRSRLLVDNLNRDSETVAAKAEELRRQIEEAGNMSADAVRQSEEDMSKVTGRYWRMIAGSIIAVMAALAIGLSFAIRISRPIAGMADHMDKLARGDLAVEAPADSLVRRDEIGKLARALQAVIESSRDETNLANAMAGGDYTHLMPLRSESDQLGRALATMLRTSNEILRGVTGAIARMSRGAQEVSNTSRSLSQGAMTSAAALEEISRSVGNIDEQAKENAGQARHANDLATASRDAAKRGYDAVNELVAAMSEIQQSGKRIATVARLIDDIAFQTNLLALNAAVEAARAGRHGKGFAVVADEVRNLSGRSAKAAKETGDMVAAMTARMEAGTSLAARTDKEFREIVAATDQVAQIFNDIAIASNDQSKALAQISSGLSQIDSAVQDATTNAKETASAAHSLEEQAENLRRSVSRFRLLPGSGDSRPAPSDHPGVTPLAPADRKAALPLGSGGAAGPDQAK